MRQKGVAWREVMKVMMLHGMPAHDGHSARSAAPPVIHGFAYGIAVSSVFWIVIAAVVVGIA